MLSATYPPELALLVTKDSHSLFCFAFRRQPVSKIAGEGQRAVHLVRQWRESFQPEEELWQADKEANWGLQNNEHRRSRAHKDAFPLSQDREQVRKLVTENQRRRQSQGGHPTLPASPRQRLLRADDFEW